MIVVYRAVPQRYESSCRTANSPPEAQRRSSIYLGKRPRRVTLQFRLHFLKKSQLAVNAAAEDCSVMTHSSSFFCFKSRKSSRAQACRVARQPIDNSNHSLSSLYVRCIRDVSTTVVSIHVKLDTLIRLNIFQIKTNFCTLKQTPKRLEDIFSSRKI